MLDRGQPPTRAGATNTAVSYDYCAVASTIGGGGAEGIDGSSEETSEEEEESEDWSDDSLDDVAAMDYAENVRLGGEMKDDGDEEEEEEEEGDDHDDDGEESDGTGDELSDARLARELQSIMSMNLDGGLPEPEWDSSEDEAFALERDEDDDETDDDDEDDDDDGDAMKTWSRVIGAAIDAGVAYIGLPPVKSSPNAPSLDDAARIAKMHKCTLEIRGGGKRRHAIIHIDALSSKVPASFVKTRVLQRAKKTNSSKKPRRMKPAVQFVSGGIAKDSDVVLKSDDEEDPRKRPVEPVPDEPVVYPNRGARRAAEAQARDREFIEKARARKRGVVVGAGHEFGAFEKHTTGFGSRMLAKMGFKGEGSGLGKTEGIAEPVTASTRGKRVGLGAFGAER